MIPYGRQTISEADVEAIASVLRSDFLTQGPKVPVFERAVADYCKIEHGVAVNSATSALHVACLALDVAPGDLVWTSPITFVASANCALYCGAEVDFVDIDPLTWNMSVERLEEKLVRAHSEGRLPKVVIPVHLCGRPCDMKAIHALSMRYGFKIIEDASHAIGGRYLGEPIGNCRYSDITVFSFHPVKIITTAEGGMATTRDDALAKRMRLLRSHGVTRDQNEMTGESDGPWYYEQVDLGFNYRMTELQAALGISQLAQLDAFVSRRHEISSRYTAMLSELPIQCPAEDENGYSGMHLYVVRLDTASIKYTHRQVFEGMRDAGIGVNLHYIPVYLQPYYKDKGFKVGLCKEAEKYYAEAISLPIYPSLTELQQDFIVNAMRQMVET